MRLPIRWFAMPVAAVVLALLALTAQRRAFHNAPAAEGQRKNPLAGQQTAAAAGRRLYGQYCAACHGETGAGTGNVPPMTRAVAQSATDGELFWYITRGDVNNGMPGWSSLPEQQRWQIVSFLRSLGESTFVAEKPRRPLPPSARPVESPAPNSPFTDYRFQKPGRVHKITVKDLPEPYATSSSGNAPKIVPRPADAWPQAPAGFRVGLYASGLNNPRLIRTAPNGDFFLAESRQGEVKVFRGITRDGKPERMEVFASGLNRPFGIAFYPPGPAPQWAYVCNTNSVVRFPYQNGDLKARGAPQHVADLPAGRGHWTRDIQFSRDGKKMFVSVGSASNVDDPDTTPAEKDRATILEFNPDGSGMRVYAFGIRNAVGLAVHPKTGELWCSVNERDALGDNLVPDYITHVQEGGFYGWPWWYMGGHQDPRHKGKRPELKEKLITPDVLLQPHFASLQMTFYDGTQFPPEYRGDIFAAQHGSWNKAMRVGYEIIRVPLHGTGRASGEYQDFLTGFVVDNERVWGRPVGVTVARDGSLLVTDDGSNSIWRVSYAGK